MKPSEPPRGGGHRVDYVHVQVVHREGRPAVEAERQLVRCICCFDIGLRELGADDTLCNLHHMLHQRFVRCAQVIQVCDVPLRDDQRMMCAHWPNVLEAETQLVLVQNCGGKFAAQDATEYRSIIFEPGSRLVRARAEATDGNSGRGSFEHPSFDPSTHPERRGIIEPPSWAFICIVALCVLAILIGLFHVTLHRKI